MNEFKGIPEIPLVIFLDLHLPGLGGIDLLTSLRRESRFKDMAVIVMTGSVNPNDLNGCDTLGVTAYLRKPVGLADFIRTVAHLFPQTQIQPTETNHGRLFF